VATTSTFPTIRQVLYSGENIQTFTAGEALTAGQVVGMAASGASMTVVAMNDTADEFPIGVVLYGVASGGDAAVAMEGCICYVCEGSGSTIDAGDLVQCDAADATVTGCVDQFAPRAVLSAVLLDAVDDTTEDAHTKVVGVAVDDIAANSTGRIMIQPYLSLWSDHTVV